MNNKREHVNGPATAGEAPHLKTDLPQTRIGATSTDEVVPPSFGQHDLGQVKGQVADADAEQEQGPPPEIPPKDEVEPVKPALKVKDATVAMFENARITQDVSPQEIGSKQIETIPVKKPAKEVWFQTHRDSRQYWYQSYVIELKEENDTYFLEPAVAAELVANGEQMVSRKMLVLSCTRAGTPFIWPIGMPSSDGKWNSWPQSAMIAATKARTKWVRLVSDRALSAYIPMTRQPDGVEPSWPPLSMAEILAVAFRGKVISTLDHPVICELRGENFTALDPMAQVNAILNEQG